MYNFKPMAYDFYKKQDAETIAKELKHIEDKNGFITAKLIVKEAEDIKHPLHHCFEWKNTIAAQKWREHQARSMLKIIVIQNEIITEPVRAFVSVRSEREHVFMNIEAVMYNPDMSQQQIEQCKRDIDKLIRKWHHLKDLQTLFQSVYSSIIP